MQHLIVSHHFGDFPAEDVVHDDARNSHEQADGRRLERQTQSDHDRIDGHRARRVHGMERQHDSEDSSQKADIGSIRRDSADHDQPPGQRNLQCLKRGERGQVEAAIEQPPFDGDGDGSHTQYQEQADDAVVDGVL